MPLAPLAYIDPTGGLPPSSWGAILAAALAALGAGVASLRLFGQQFFTWIASHRRGLLLATVFLTAGLLMRFWWFGRGTPVPTPGPRVLVLAFDGLDPRLLEQYLAEGRLPPFARLVREGRYHPLPT